MRKCSKLESSMPVTLTQRWLSAGLVKGPTDGGKFDLSEPLGVSFLFEVCWGTPVVPPIVILGLSSIWHETMPLKRGLLRQLDMSQRSPLLIAPWMKALALKTAK